MPSQSYETDSLGMGSRSRAFFGMGTWRRSDYLMHIDFSGWRGRNNFEARDCGGVLYNTINILNASGLPI